MSEFDSKIYVVTGGASGMGLATVTLLVEGGAYVYVADIAEKMSEGLSKLDSRRLTYRKCDVSKRAEVNAFMKNVLDTHSQLDGLVAAAGMVTVEDEIGSDEMFDQVF